jgi:amino acid transporter
MTLASLRKLMVGDPLPTAAEVYQRLTKVKALAVFSSDALSSVAYATEEILLVLVTATASGASLSALGLSLPIAIAIAILLAIVATSYYQTIHGYPSGGGAYIVAYDNLGAWPGLTAAAALLIDYVLTVAVSTTAGVAAITSAVPALLPYRVPLCLLAIALITWANLRGVRESGTLFSVPTYGFVIILLALITIGLVRLLTGGLTPVQAPASTATAQAMQGVTIFLILRAFASGCTALTGIEAISNGIPAFQKPEADNAGKTLVAMATLLTTMFLGITFLARALHVVPVEHETIVSQIGRLVFGSGPVYLILQGATALILVLAANTSFADFPRLSAILARDHFLPRQLTNLGDRLVFANGIILLAVLASGLIVIFGGLTHRLIPLYAVGVFLSFTLSQAGMVRHWLRDRGPGWQWKTAVNGLGAATTAVVLVIVVATKFTHGAWVVILLIPIFVWVFHMIRQHYVTLAEQLSLDGLSPQKWEDDSLDRWHKVVLPISGVHRGILGALRFARSLSQDVTAVVVDVDPRETARLLEKWPTWGHGTPMVVLESPYRSTLGPLLGYLEEVDARDPDRGLGVVVLPEFVPARRWHRLLHNQTARMIKKALLYGREHSDRDRIIIDVPYHLQR